MSENYGNVSPKDQEELQKLEQNLAAMPDSAAAHYNLGLALAHRGQVGPGNRPFQVCDQTQAGAPRGEGKPFRGALKRANTIRA